MQFANLSGFFALIGLPLGKYCLLNIYLHVSIIFCIIFYNNYFPELIKLFLCMANLFGFCIYIHTVQSFQLLFSLPILHGVGLY